MLTLCAWGDPGGPNLGQNRVSQRCHADKKMRVCKCHGGVSPEVSQPAEKSPERCQFLGCKSVNSRWETAKNGNTFRGRFGGSSGDLLGPVVTPLVRPLVRPLGVNVTPL